MSDGVVFFNDRTAAIMENLLRPEAERQLTRAEMRELLLLELHTRGSIPEGLAGLLEQTA